MGDNMDKDDMSEAKEEDMRVCIDACVEQGMTEDECLADAYGKAKNDKTGGKKGGKNKSGKKGDTKGDNKDAGKKRNAKAVDAKKGGGKISKDGSDTGQEGEEDWSKADWVKEEWGKERKEDWDKKV